MAKSQKTKHSGAAQSAERAGGERPSKLPEPARSLAESVRKDVADAEDESADRPSTETQVAEQMEEWVTTRAPSARKPRGSE